MADKEQVTFQYANECDLEIHCSPFGLLGLYIKIKGTDIMGIGLTMGLITGSSTGLLHYNDSKDLMDQKYKLYVVVDDEGFLRIDFTKILNLQGGGSWNGGQGETSDSDKKEEEGSVVSNSLTDKATPYLSVSGSHDLPNEDEEEKIMKDTAPTLVFKGKCPEGRPDKIDPFIGIFSFEREN